MRIRTYVELCGVGGGMLVTALSQLCQPPMPSWLGEFGGEICKLVFPGLGIIGVVIIIVSTVALIVGGAQWEAPENKKDAELVQLRRDIGWLKRSLSDHAPFDIQREEIAERYERLDKSDHLIWDDKEAYRLLKDFLNRCGILFDHEKTRFESSAERQDTVSEMIAFAEQLDAILAKAQG